MRNTKQPVSAVLTGPYGHPFHPLLVTVPIGAWISSLVFDLASYVVTEPAFLVEGARWLIGTGVLGALAAATVGFLDFLGIAAGTPAHRTALVHLSLNITITSAYIGNFVWRQDLSSGDGSTPMGPFALSVLSVAALAVSGSLGGKLAYRYGVRVADETTQADGFRPGRTSD